jgi:hypothetical protein
VLSPDRRDILTGVVAANEITVDESCLPLVFLKFPAHVDADSVARFCARYNEMLARERRFVNVTDATLVSERPPATVRQQLADWSRENDARMVRLSCGDARVVRSSIIRGAMTAVSWLHKPKVPQEWFSSKEEAITWAMGQLDAGNVAIPPEIRRRFTIRAAT